MNHWKYLVNLILLSAGYLLFLQSGMSGLVDESGQLILFIAFLLVSAGWAGSLFKALRLGRETGYIAWALLLSQVPLLDDLNWNLFFVDLVLGLSVAVVILYRVIHTFQISERPVKVAGLKFLWLLMAVSLLTGWLITTGLAWPAALLPALLLISSDGLIHSHYSTRNPLLPFKMVNWLPGILLILVLWVLFTPLADGSSMIPEALLSVGFGLFTGWILSKYENRVSKNLLPVFLIAVIGWVFLVLLAGFPFMLILAMIIGTGLVFGWRYNGENSYVHDIIYPANVGNIALTTLLFFIITPVWTFESLAWGGLLLAVHLVLHTIHWLWIRYREPDLAGVVSAHHMYEFLLISPVTLVLVSGMAASGTVVIPPDLLTGFLVFFILNRTVIPPVFRVVFPGARTEEKEVPVPPAGQIEKPAPESLKPFGFSDPDLTRELTQLYEDIRAAGKKVSDAGLSEQLEDTTNYILMFQEGAIDSLMRLKTGLREQGEVEAGQWKALVREERSRLNQWYSDLALKTANQRLYQDRFRELFPSFFREVDARILRLKPILNVPVGNEITDPAPGDSLQTRVIRWSYRSGAWFQRRILKTTLTRPVLVRDLARFHFSGRFTERAEKVVNLFHAETWYAISETNKVLNRVDKTFQQVLEVTDQFGDTIPVDSLLTILKTASQAVSEDLQLLLNEITLYSDDVEKSLKHLINLTMNELAAGANHDGTLLLSRRSYQFHRVAANRQRAMDRYAMSDETWGNYALAVANHLSLELEISTFQFNLRQILDAASEEFGQLTKNRITGPVDGLRKRLLQLKRKYTRLADAGESAPAIMAALREDGEAFSVHCDKQIRRLEQAVRVQEGSQFQTAYFQKIHDLMMKLPDQQVVYDTRQVVLKAGENPPPAISVTVDIRSLAIQVMEAELVRAVSDEFRLLDGFMETSLQQLTEISKIVGFNTESVLMVIEKSGNDRAVWSPVLHEQLLVLADRLMGRLDDFIADIERNTDRIHQAMVAETVEKSRSLKTAIQVRSVLDYQAATAGAAAFRYTDLNIFRRLKDGAKYWFHRLEIMSRRRYGALAGEMLEDLHLRFPTARKHADTLSWLQQQAIEAERKFASLPLIYRRLFSFDALETEDLLIGRRDELIRLTTSWAAWHDDSIPQSVAVIGDLGSGKTSLINIALRAKKIGQPVIRRKLTSVLESPDDLVRFLAEAFGLPDHIRQLEQVKLAIRALDTRTTVIVDSFQKVMVRRPGGFDAAGQFINLMAETADQLFWIISINEQAWTVLEQRFRISRFFTVKINLGRWTADDIRHTILARQRVSGYGLRFRITDWQQVKIKLRFWAYWNKERREKLITDRYFRKLIRYSDASILKALLVFVRSIDQFDDQQVWLKDPAPLDHSGFTELTDLQWQLVAAVIIHGGISADRMAGLFHQPEADIRARLMVLANCRLLDMTTHRGTWNFTVNRWMYGYLYTELKQRGYLI